VLGYKASACLTAPVDFILGWYFQNQIAYPAVMEKLQLRGGLPTYTPWRGWMRVVSTLINFFDS